jgi:hypothetical protein
MRVYARLSDTPALEESTFLHRSSCDEPAMASSIARWRAIVNELNIGALNFSRLLRSRR